MKINIEKEKLLKLMTDGIIELKELDNHDKNTFINEFGNTLLDNAFKSKSYKQLNELFNNETIKNHFLNKIKLTTSNANISYINNLDSIINLFVLEMSRQNIEEKQEFFDTITKFCLENPIEMRKFFNLRTEITSSGFEREIPIGMYYLRVAGQDAKKLLDLEIISKDLFSLTKKTTLIHYLHLYPYETSKYLIDTIDLNSTLKDKDDLNHTPLDKLITDLRFKNIDLIDYLFTEKLEINLFKRELINYVVKGANILRNKQTKQSLRDRVIESLEKLFNLENIQNNEELKKEIAQNIVNKVTPEIHYLWLNAKLGNKPSIKKSKI